MEISGTCSAFPVLINKGREEMNAIERYLLIESQIQFSIVLFLIKIY